MITINPAQLSATISTPDLNYTGAAQTPVVTTNVTGHIPEDDMTVNPLTCEFRDEAGEWQSTVPSFTEPGTYKLFFRVSAPNHVTYTTNCTFTIAGWDFMVNLDGQTGYPFPLRVTDPGWFLRVGGYTGEQFAIAADRYVYLDTVCDNGLKLWHNYVIEREDLTEKIYAAIHQSCQRVTENHFEIRFPNVEVLRNTGLAAYFRLDKKLGSSGLWVDGDLTGHYELNIPLSDDSDPTFDPTGLYEFNIVLAQTNDLGEVVAQAVLPSCATIGVLRVSSAATNTIVAVPWRSASKGEDVEEDVLINETVNPNGLCDATRMYAWDTNGPSFHGWSFELGTQWSAIAAGTSDGIAVTPTSATEFPRGGAFWLVRPAPTNEYIYLVGRYDGGAYSTALAGGSTNAPGFTMVANPTMEAVNLNSLTFSATPAADDRIVIQDAAGFQKVYVRNAANTEWGRWVSRKSEGLVTQEWVNNDGIVPSGTGFWYVRTATGSLAIEIGGAQ